MQYNTSELTEEQRIFQDMMADFADEVLAPMVDEAEETGHTPLALFTKMAEMGFLCPRYPEELGGGGADKLSECIMIEQVCRVNAGFCGAIVAHSGLGTMPIFLHGSQEQKEKYLIPAIQGKKNRGLRPYRAQRGLRRCLHSDPGGARRRRIRDQRTKMFITNAPSATT